jgi:3-oxoadipate enol-lactonase
VTISECTDGRPVLLLLHALGVSGECWEPVTALLDDFTVLSPDFPGHGSAALADSPMTVRMLADSLAERLRDAGITRAHVAGMSLGGLVAQELAAVYPELVDRLVLVDTVATYPEVVRQQWRDRALIARDSGTASLVEPTIEAWFTRDAIEAASPAVVLVKEMIATVDPEGYARACELLEQADTRDSLGAITAPTLIVCGRDDLPAFLAAVPMFEGSITDSQVAWIDPGRHAAVLESPAAFVAALRDFLQRA